MNTEMKLTIICQSSVQTAIIKAHCDTIAYALRLSRDIRIEAQEGVITPAGHQGGYAEDLVTGIHCIYIDTSKGHIVQALAHELRHAYQTEHNTLGPYDWSLPYCDRPHERDAVAYATDYISSL